MAVRTYTEEFESPVAPVRLFKALVLNGHNLLPKLMPETFKSIEFLEGSLIAVGSVKQYNFSDGFPYKYGKHRIDEIDVSNFYIKYTVTEGDVLAGRYEYIVSESKYEPKGSGCVCKLTNHVKPLAGVVFNEEAPKMGLEQLKKMLKAVEEYLIANPGAYA